MNKKDVIKQSRQDIIVQILSSFSKEEIVTCLIDETKEAIFRLERDIADGVYECKEYLKLNKKKLKLLNEIALINNKCRGNY